MSGVIIQALSRYYDILASDEDTDIARNGYSSEKVSYALLISTDGDLVDILPCNEEVTIGKKLRSVPKRMILPYQGGRSGINPPPNLLYDNSKYVLGLGTDKSGALITMRDRFEGFKSHHMELFESEECDESTALLRFLERWDIEQAAVHPVVAKWLPDIVTGGGNIVFRLDGHTRYVHEVPQLKAIWEKYTAAGEVSTVQQCLVTGEIGPIERLHPKIKGVKDTNSAGANIVSFKDASYESYGKKQGENAPVNRSTTFAYGTVLNHMLGSTKQKIQIGDATTVFWAESPESIYTDLSALMFNPPNGSLKEEQHTQDRKVEQLVSTVLNNAKSGMKTGNLSNYVNPETRFYILGLSPNVARISIRFFHQTDFGKFINQVAKHYGDMTIVKQFDNEMDNIPLWAIVNETVPKSSKDKKPNPLLTGTLMRSILEGTPYPAILLTSILQRIRSDQEVNYVRAAIIKAFLLRSTDNFREELSVELDEGSTNPAYRLGRLFAVLEKVQSDAIESSQTIRDKYIASASATPSIIFPRLLSMPQHQFSKAGSGKRNDHMIENIVQSFDANECFPPSLSVEEQGAFFIGYYHQRKALFTKQEKGGI